MRIFKHYNKTGGSTCPICETNDDKETTLVGIVGTAEGYNIQAAQFHVDCLELLYDLKNKVIIQAL